MKALKYLDNLPKVSCIFGPPKLSWSINLCADNSLTDNSLTDKSPTNDSLIGQFANCRHAEKGYVYN